MDISSRSLVEFVLLGPTNDRRQLQDSPILGDVWIAFAAKPDEAIDLLISPYKERPAGPVAVDIEKHIRRLKLRDENSSAADVAYLQGLVAAQLFFCEVLRVIVPRTQWWREQRIKGDLEEYRKGGWERLSFSIQAVLDWVTVEGEKSKTKAADKLAQFTALDRFTAMAGIILWAGAQWNSLPPKNRDLVTLLEKSSDLDSIVKGIRGTLEEVQAEVEDGSIRKEPQIWQVSLNRKAMPALERSVQAVKGDAARMLFNVKCDAIKWAILDSGIDGTHDVFKDAQGDSRIVRAFDFSNMRKIVSLGPKSPKTFTELVENPALKNGLDGKEAESLLDRLGEDADNERPINWEIVERFIEIKPETPPPSGHGTHVAGILGAYAKPTDDKKPRYVNGMCPEIKLYDFRVLGKTLEDTEFAIIAALQYIRYLNDRHTYISIHGANLSLSIPHDVRNFACGRTPICNECERLVEGGVVVVAAAGNLGYQAFETKDSSYQGYTAFSITDPGNADGVLTVGATHRFKPHTYGVSFFSSRGPTGDGRLKPDLVAPGERIESCLPGAKWGELDGTSMAAPHVSGAAAMLMARYSELIGEPRRIKRILCESATDLGRERSFQGHGMLDVLRALQSI